MDTHKTLQLVQLTYAAALADATAEFAKEGVLEKVVERKRAEQMATGKMRAAQFGVSTPEEVFTRLGETFDCARWTILHENDCGFIAEARACKLCAIAKKMNAPAPCALYCLNPMEGMVKGLRPQADFHVEETLWNGEACRVRISS
jgi:hypothetical protein